MSNEMRSIQSWDDMKKCIYPVLLSKETVRNMSEELVSYPFLDLVVVYTVGQPCTLEEDKACLVGRRNLCQWGIDRKILYEQALENLVDGESGYDFQPLLSVIRELINNMEFSGNAFFEPFPEKYGMYLLTNQERLLGAACILNKGFLRKISGGKSLYLLPSSIHEFLIMKDFGNIEQGELDMVVKSVNYEQVLPCEQLANHAYYYDYDKDEIQISKNQSDM